MDEARPREPGRHDNVLIARAVAEQLTGARSPQVTDHKCVNF